MIHSDELTELDHKTRSLFIQKLIQKPFASSVTTNYTQKIPLKIVQFWDRLDSLPKDVQECIETWSKVKEQGIDRILFDKKRARDFIFENMGLRYVSAFDKCYHPAMQSDYFRLCYIFAAGGCYIDTDDVFSGAQIQHLFNDGKLKIQPLCYDISNNSMVSPQIFTKSEANNNSWIFYFNNNPLIACDKHPIIERALSQATLQLEKDITQGLPEIQSTTGPGNLSKSIFDIVSEKAEMVYSLKILSNWEEIAQSKWELGYRNDFRNWRNSNCIKFQ